MSDKIKNMILQITPDRLLCSSNILMTKFLVYFSFNWIFLLWSPEMQRFLSLQF